MQTLGKCLSCWRIFALGDNADLWWFGGEAAERCHVFPHKSVPANGVLRRKGKGRKRATVGGQTLIMQQQC